MKFKRKILLSFVISALSLGIVQIIFSTAFTTAGLDLSQLQIEKAVIEKENMLLSENLYERSSFTTIAQKAQSEGFAENAKSRMVMGKTPAVAFVR